MNKKQRYNIDELNNSDIPYSVMFNGSRIEILGNSKMFVEGKYSIKEYNSESIKLKLSKMNLLIFGEKLMLGSVEQDGFLITGNILNIQFE